MSFVLYSSDLISYSSWWTSTPKATVKSIIDTYTELIYSEVQEGKTVSFLSMVTFNGETSSPERYPLGYYCYKVAKQLGLDTKLVTAVLERYKELIERELLTKNVVVVYGLVKFTPLNSGKVSVKSSTRLGKNNVKVRAKLNPYWFCGVQKFVGM
jgi:hypothetical protein